MKELELNCFEGGDNILLSVEDNWLPSDKAGKEVYLNIQDWSLVHHGLATFPELVGIVLDKDRAEQLIQYLTTFYKLDEKEKDNGKDS